MKSIRTILAPIMTLFVAVAVTTSVGATGFFLASENSNATVPVGRTIDSSAFLFGSQVTVDGTIKGDLYCAGENVSVKGVVEGDVICAGSNVSITGAVLGDIRVAGAEVNIGGATKGSALAVGSVVRTTTDFTLGGDLTVGAETVELWGVLGRDILVGSGSTRLGATVARDASVYTDTISVDKTAQVTGNLWYKASERTQVPEGSVAGNTVFEQAPKDSSSDGSGIGSALVLIVGMTLLTVVAVLVAPRFIHTAATLEPREVVFAGLAGLATVVLLPIVAIVFMVSIVGLWVGFVLLFVWILLALMSSVFVAYYVGTLVLRKRATHALLVGAVGAVVLSIVLLIPFINVIVFMLMLFVGVGMQVMHLKYQFSKNPYSIV